MKRLLLFLGLLAFAYSEAPSQIVYMYSSDTTAGTTWKKYAKPNARKIYQFEVSNDSSSGTSQLYIALSSTDTSANRRFWLDWGETIFFESVNVDTVAIRASTGSIPYRIRYH